MNERIEHCLYQAGLTAQGCWEELDDYAKEGIEKFAELLVKECLEMMGTNISGTFDSDWDFDTQVKYVKAHFGVEE